MKLQELGRARLMSLQVAASRARNATDVVSSLCAMQAQDYAGGLWAIGLRVPGATLADVEAALAARSIVRSWPLRGTLHIVAAADLGWLLDLLAPRVIKASARRHQQLELDAATFLKAEQLLVRALSGGRQLTREAIGALLEAAGISPAGGRLYHVLWRLSLEQVLCFGVPEGKQPTFTLLNEWVPSSLRLERELALKTLATRYFQSHGPATAQDLMRWAGLTSAEAKLGIAAAEGLTSFSLDGRPYYLSADQPALAAAARATFLLPGFDEYILGYGDRSAILDPEHAEKIVPGANGVFRPTIVHDGKVVGTWSAVANKKTVRLQHAGFATLSKSQQQGFARAAKHYAAFLGRTAVVD